MDVGVEDRELTIAPVGDSRSMAGGVFRVGRMVSGVSGEGGRVGVAILGIWRWPTARWHRSASDSSGTSSDAGGDVPGGQSGSVFWSFCSLRPHRLYPSLLGSQAPHSAIGWADEFRGCPRADLLVESVRVVDRPPRSAAAGSRSGGARTAITWFWRHGNRNLLEVANTC